MTTPFLSFPYEQRAATHFHRSVGRPVLSSPPGQPAFGRPESEEEGRYVLNDALLLLFCGLVGVVALVGVLAVAFHLSGLWAAVLLALGLLSWVLLSGNDFTADFAAFPGF